MAKITREQMWRSNYREKRDLDHLALEQLGDRMIDCCNNQYIWSKRGKMGISDPKKDLGQWMQLQTEVMEEFVLRKTGYPGPISGDRFREAVFNPTDPVPNTEAVLSKRGMESKPYLLKFGDPKWLTEALEFGRFQISPASFYDSDSHNYARRDEELSRTFFPHPSHPHIPEFLKSIGEIPPDGKTCSKVVVQSPSDYYLFSSSMFYSPRLYSDFGATACLVIHDSLAFLKQFGFAVIAHLGREWDHTIGLIQYFDPVRADPGAIEVSHYKPFRHAYQQEMRLTWSLPETEEPLEPFIIEVGSLRDCAELVTIDSHPPIVYPPDPNDAPVIAHGTINKDKNMVNELPEMSRMQGITLYRQTNNPKDWFFHLQYTDADEKWHRIKVPLLDGLYLLNLLEGAEKDQHLEIFNRKPR